MIRKLLLAVMSLSLACGGEPQPANSADNAAEEKEAPEPGEEPPNELARALIRLQTPDIGADERRDAMKGFVEVFLQSQVYVPASGPVTDRSTLECFTDAASVAVRYPGQDARPVDGRGLLAHARDKGYGVVIRHESARGAVYTGFTPADAARLLEI